MNLNDFATRVKEGGREKGRGSRVCDFVRGCVLFHRICFLDSSRLQVERPRSPFDSTSPSRIGAPAAGRQVPPRHDAGALAVRAAVVVVRPVSHFSKESSQSLQRPQTYERCTYAACDTLHIGVQVLARGRARGSVRDRGSPREYLGQFLRLQHLPTQRHPRSTSSSPAATS